MTNMFDRETRKERLKAQLETNRKLREKRFNRLAIPLVVIAFGIFLFGTESGHEIVRGLGWLSTEDAWPMRWFLAYCFLGGIMTLGLDWLLSQLLRKEKRND